MSALRWSITAGLDVPRAWREAPSLAGVRAHRLVTGNFYLAGCITVLAGVVALHGDLNRVPMTALGLLAGLAAVVILLRGDQPGRGLYHLLVAAGTLLITAEVLLAGGGTASVAMGAIYAFPVIDALFLFPLREAALHLAFTAIVGAAAMQRADVPVGDVVVLGWVGLVICLVTAWLTRIADAAEVDFLTGLLNRRGLDRRAEQEISLLRRIGPLRAPLAVIVLDIDDFKRINDTGGHVQGDRALAACATAWQQGLPSTAVLGRYGGDEFAALLPGCTLARAGDIADTLRSLTPPGIRASAGVAAARPDDSMSILIGRADSALYEAKVAGRDRTVVHGDPTRLGREIERAAARNELVLQFQPIVNLDSERVAAHEALVRWDHPSKGMLMPDSFVPESEQSGAIHVLGAWVREEAARRVMAGPEPRSPVTVNASIHELRCESYVGEVADLLGRWEMPADLLAVEVTEGVFDEADPQVLATVGGLRDLGILITMDDFGAGFSSLRRLAELPIDVLKIDGTLVQSIKPNSDEAPILQAILTMARSLGMKVVAERVETAHQASVLRGMGYDFVQGYLYGKPSPALALHNSVVHPALAVPDQARVPGSGLAGALPRR